MLAVIYICYNCLGFWSNFSQNHLSYINLSKEYPQEIRKTKFKNKLRRGSHKKPQKACLMHLMLVKLCQVYHACPNLIYFCITNGGGIGFTQSLALHYRGVTRSNWCITESSVGKPTIWPPRLVWKNFVG